MVYCNLQPMSPLISIRIEDVKGIEGADTINHISPYSRHIPCRHKKRPMSFRHIHARAGSSHGSSRRDAALRRVLDTDALCSGAQVCPRGRLDVHTIPVKHPMIILWPFSALPDSRPPHAGGQQPHSHSLYRRRNARPPPPIASSAVVRTNLVNRVWFLLRLQCACCGYHVP